MLSGASDGELDLLSALGLTAGEGASAVADLVGIQRQVAVLAFQFGDGFSNIVVPTNPVLMGILGAAAIPYERWLRFVLPLLAKWLVAAAVALVIAVSIGYH